MWAALRSDLAEFVSTVAEDTTHALSTLDETIGKKERDQKAVQTTGDGSVAYEDDDGDDDDDDDESPIYKQETYTEPLVPDEAELLKAKDDRKRRAATTNEEETNENATTEEDDNEEIIDDDEAEKGDNEITTEKTSEEDTLKLEDIVVEGDKEKKGEENGPTAGKIANTNDDTNDNQAEDENEEKKEEEEEVRRYIIEFDIESVTEEIAYVLDHSSVVRSFMEELVPTRVSYEAFWLRYFWRVSLEEEEEEQDSDSPTPKPLKGVVNFFGNAVAAVANAGGAAAAVAADVQRNRDEYASATTTTTTDEIKTAGPMGLAGALLGRPPFVMNTAVDDDDDDDEDDEEEEELGWDDDDDDDDDDDQSEIVFSSNNPAASDEFKKLRAERNELSKRVALQNDEIHSLQTLLDTLKSGQPTQMEIMLFDANAEIAALRASLQAVTSKQDGMAPLLARLEEQRTLIRTLRTSKEEESTEEASIPQPATSTENSEASSYVLPSNNNDETSGGEGEPKEKDPNKLLGDKPINKTNIVDDEDEWGSEEDGWEQDNDVVIS